MRLNLIHPGLIMGPQRYNEVFTTHGIIMIFLFIIPGVPVAFGNFLLPLMIGARDVAFPRINRLSWRVYLTGAAMIAAALFINGHPPDTGWTFYAPYSIRTHANVTLAVMGVFVLGFSSIRSFCFSARCFWSIPFTATGSRPISTGGRSRKT